MINETMRDVGDRKHSLTNRTMKCCSHRRNSGMALSTSCKTATLAKYTFLHWLAMHNQTSTRRPSYLT